MPTRLSATLLGMGGVVLWATETVLITFTTRIPPLQTVALAFLFAALLAPFAWRATGDNPFAAFRQPVHVWLLVVGSLVGYHASIYWATQQAPPAAAALLQGTTPLLIMLGSALLPGERLRAWHVAGAVIGLAGIILLIDGGDATAKENYPAPAFHLALIGVAAGLWGLYSVLSRRYADVPTSALGVFYAASAVICVLLHVSLETWVAPTSTEWGAIAALGILPMGLALYLWDVGVKRGDIQALGAISYVEPFIGAALVALLGQGRFDATLTVSGLLVVSGALLASRDLLGGAETKQDAIKPTLDVIALDELRWDLIRATERCLRMLEQKPPSITPDEEQLIAARLLDLWRSIDATRAVDPHRLRIV